MWTRISNTTDTSLSSLITVINSKGLTDNRLTGAEIVKKEHIHPGWNGLWISPASFYGCFCFFVSNQLTH